MATLTHSFATVANAGLALTASSMPLPKQWSGALDTRIDIDHSVSDWEARQKHAAFFQSMVVSTQQAAGAGYAVMTVLITLGLGLANMRAQLAEHGPMFLQICVLAWIAVTLTMTAIFRRSAQRIDRTYRDEHARLFPRAAPYKLESFLLTSRTWF